MNTEALVLSLALLGLAVFLRIGTGSWLHPAAMFTGWWMLAAILPLIVASDEPVSAGAVAWVIIACIAVSAGAIAGSGGLTIERPRTPPPVSRFSSVMLSWPALAFTVLGLLSSVTFAVASGVSLRDMLDIQRVVAVTNQLYAARFVAGDAASPPLVSQALLPFVYLAPALGGMIMVIRKERRWKTVAVLTMLPALAVTALQTTKAAVLFAATLWLCAYFAARLRVGELRVFTKTHVILGCVVGIMAGVLFFAVGLARLATTDTSLAALVRVKLITAAFGHMSVFSSWLSDYWSQPFDPTLGEYTLSGPLGILGLKHRVPGVFDNVVELVAGETSNIFTGFRPLIEDFTMPGALAILALLGAVSGWSYRAVAQAKWGALPVFIGAYMTMLWTPITWFWIYNSLTATVVAVGLIVFFIRLWRRSRHPRELKERLVSTTQ